MFYTKNDSLTNYDYNKKFTQILSDREMVFKNYARRCNMPQVEHWLLFTVYMGMINGEEYTQKECSDLWAFPKQTINSAAKKLLNKGLIYLKTSNNDRRKKAIYLTEWGIEVAKEIMQPLIDCEISSFEALDYQEKEIFISLLNKIYVSLKAKVDVLYEENKVNFKILNKGEKDEL